MTSARKMLLETLQGHLKLLGRVSPKKAASPVARRAERYLREFLGQNRCKFSR